MCHGRCRKQLHAGTLLVVVAVGPAVVHNVPSHDGHPLAIVDVFEVPWVLFIKGPNLPAGAITDHHETTGNPVAAKRVAFIAVSIQVSLPGGRKGLEPRNSPGQHHSQGRKAASGMGEPTILVENPTTSQTTAGMPFHEIEHLPDGPLAWIELHIRVQDQGVRCCGSHQDSVHIGGVTLSSLIVQHSMVRKPFFQTVNCIVRTVVDKNQPHWHTLCRSAQRFQ